MQDYKLRIQKGNDWQSFNIIGSLIRDSQKVEPGGGRVLNAREISNIGAGEWPLNLESRRRSVQFPGAVEATVRLTEVKEGSGASMRWFEGRPLFQESSSA